MGDFNADHYRDKFVSELVRFVAGNEFQTMFEAFFLEFAMEFSYEREHKLRYYEIYQMFQEKFEGQLEKFRRSQDISESEFVTRCRAAAAEDEKAKKYIDILLASAEYETFVKLMQIMRPVAEARLELMAAQAEADAKQGQEDDNFAKDSPSKASKSTYSNEGDEGDDKGQEMREMSDAKGYDNYETDEKYSSK